MKNSESPFNKLRFASWKKDKGENVFGFSLGRSTPDPAVLQGIKIQLEEWSKQNLLTSLGQSGGVWGYMNPNCRIAYMPKSRRPDYLPQHFNLSVSDLTVENHDGLKGLLAEWNKKNPSAKKLHADGLKERADYLLGNYTKLKRRG